MSAYDNDLTARRPPAPRLAPAGIARRQPQRSLASSAGRMMGLSRSGTTAAIIALALGALGAFVSPSPLAVFASGASLAAIFIILWDPNEPPILLFPMLYQWSMVATKPILTVFYQTTTNELADYGQDIESAAFFGLAAVALVSLGLRLGAGRASQNWNEALANEARAVSRNSLLKVAVSAIVIGHVLLLLIGYTGPARQLVLAMSGIRFAGLFALAYWCLTNRSGYSFLVLALLLEVVAGFTSYFSDFRPPVLAICLAALASRHKLKAKDTAVLAVLVTLLVSLGSFWSDIKLDYRVLLGGGTNAQVVTVPVSQRLNYLADQAATFNGTRFGEGFDLLLRRHSYIDFLGAAMEHVPEVIPHEHGARVGKTILHIITPRIFFPNKPPTEFDTEIVQLYTGLPLMQWEGTSISLGYVGELYVDFGVYGALLACVGLGFAGGAGYRFVRNRGRGSVLLIYGVRAMAILTFIPFDSALIKLVGGAASALIAAALLERFVLPRLVRQLRLKPSQRRPGLNRSYA